MTKEDYELLCETMNGKDKPPAFAVKLLEDTCERTGLDWKTRQVYLMNRSGKWKVELSIDGFRTIANSQDDYDGQTEPLWTMGEGQPWSDIPPDKFPYAAKVGVRRKGQSQPTWGVAKYKDYRPKSGHMWDQFASTMIAKCAEMLALRKAFPQKLSGLYGAEEMVQADKEKPRKVDTTPQSVSSLPADSVQNLEAPTNFGERITTAKTREELQAVGAEIAKSTLGLEAKMALSRAYNTRKATEGWE